VNERDLVTTKADGDEVPWLPPLEEPRRRPDPNAWMRPLSMWVSGLAFLCMAVGFLWFVGGSSGAFALPGEPGLPLGSLWRAVVQAPPLALMSLGMVLLGLLPVLRVALALAFYLRERAREDVLVAVAVLVLLLVSMVLK
jgi:uncharacterized membrane protein